MSDTSTPPVVTVTPTICDGTVVRWHRDVSAAANHRMVVSVSRNGVSIHTEYLHQVADGWLVAAKAVYEQLRRDRNADVKHLVTHRNSVVSSGPLVPVQREADDA